MKTRFLLAAAILLGWSGTAPAWVRTWTDATGKHTLEADFMDSGAGKVWLRNTGGRTFSLPMDQLSKADQQYVRQQVRQRKEALKLRTSRQPGDIQYGPGRRIATLANQTVDESSGLACSRRLSGLFWTHNDSGGDASLYLLDAKGRDLGSCTLQGVLAYDWEDMASFRLGGKGYLLVADTGNNGLAAAVHMLYLVEEPPVDPKRGVTVKQVPVARLIHFSYEDDHRNCEAVALDPTSKTFLLATKERPAGCYVYALPWPENDPKKAFTARRIATLKLPGATAMDISPDGLRAVVLTYGNAYEYRRGAKEDWAKGFSRPPREIVLPKRAQGESICYGPDGKTLYLTSEQLPTPLLEVPVK